MKRVAVLSIGILILVMALWGCKKQFADPTYAPAGGSAVRVWYKTNAFYFPKADVFLEATGVWRPFTSFPLIYDNDPNKYGFGNPYLPGKGSNALNMNSFYSTVPGGLTSDSGYYNVTIPKCFEFNPDGPGAKKGEVKVIPQKVRLYKRDKTYFEIGISGSGRYDEIAQLFEVEIIFDDTEIGGPKELKRKYRFRP
jgi:hypothetical protein